MNRVAWIALSAAVLVLVAVGAVVLVVVGGGKPMASVPLAQHPSALALGDHDGNVLVGLAVRPGGPLEVTALRAETPIATNALRIEIDGQPVDASACGSGCSRVEAAVLDGSPSRMTVRAGSATVSFALPARLPPSGTALFSRAQKTMDGLSSFRFTEHLTSGSGGLKSRFDVQAPNRLRIRAENGFRVVIIGRTRWDYLDGRWERAPFPGLEVAQMLMWDEAKHARVVGRRANGVTELVAYGLKPVPAWFRLSVEPSGRVVEAEMTAASHFMLHRYSDFNGRFEIKPPK